MSVPNFSFLAFLEVAEKFGVVVVVVVGGNTTHVCMANIEDNVLNYIIFHICTEFVVSNFNALNSHGFKKKTLLQSVATSLFCIWLMPWIPLRHSSHFSRSEEDHRAEF